MIDCRLEDRGLIPDKGIYVIDSRLAPGSIRALIRVLEIIFTLA
jgi:hypothetical protein